MLNNQFKNLFKFLAQKIGMTKFLNKSGNLLLVSILYISNSFVQKIFRKFIFSFNKVLIKHSFPIIKKKLNPFFINYFNNTNKIIKEYKTNYISNYKLGFTYDASRALNNSDINLSGLTIGKGYAGNIKKNKFSSGPLSHGSKHHRLQGSLGAGTTPGRVFPGKKMSGRLGNSIKTINSKIILLNNKKNIIFVNGSIPGKRSNLFRLNFK